MKHYFPRLLNFKPFDFAVERVLRSHIHEGILSRCRIVVHIGGTVTSINIDNRFPPTVSLRITNISNNASACATFKAASLYFFYR